MIKSDSNIPKIYFNISITYPFITYNRYAYIAHQIGIKWKAIKTHVKTIIFSLFIASILLFFTCFQLRINIFYVKLIVSLY